MKYCQVNAEGALNFNELFADYNSNVDFEAAVSDPVAITAGNVLQTETMLGENCCKVLEENNESVSVVGLITCTALIAKCGQSNYFVMHVGSGYITDDTKEKLRQLANAYPNGRRQAVYVIPNQEYLNTYKDNIEEISRLEYETCFITRQTGVIGTVQIKGNGDMCIF